MRFAQKGFEERHLSEKYAIAMHLVDYLLTMETEAVRMLRSNSQTFVG